LTTGLPKFQENLNRARRFLRAKISNKLAFSDAGYLQIGFPEKCFWYIWKEYFGKFVKVLRKGLWARSAGQVNLPVPTPVIFLFSRLITPSPRKTTLHPIKKDKAIQYFLAA